MRQSAASENRLRLPSRSCVIGLRFSLTTLMR
ncbi:Uncharacterised protein [Mycobacterium tuberculosis]|nr:Uncharacterised protein [Mycobacterium tuberculosis]